MAESPNRVIALFFKKPGFCPISSCEKRRRAFRSPPCAATTRQMSVLNPRNRLVNFRLSDVEYEALQAACHTQGARSLSEFARTAILRLLEEPSSSDTPGDARMEKLDQKVSQLDLRVEQLRQLLTPAGLASIERHVAAPLTGELQHN
jgi:hypothetical protein